MGQGLERASGAGGAGDVPAGTRSQALAVLQACMAGARPPGFNRTPAAAGRGTP